MVATDERRLIVSNNTLIESDNSCNSNSHNNDSNNDGNDEEFKATSLSLSRASNVAEVAMITTLYDSTDWNRHSDEVDFESLLKSVNEMLSNKNETIVKATVGWSSKLHYKLSEKL
jgi:hypothetical protein